MDALSTKRICDGIIVGCLVAAVCVTIGWLAPAPPGFENVVLVALLFTGMTAGTAAIRYFVTRDLLDPLVLFSAALAWYFGLHTLWMSNAAHASQVQHTILATFVPYLASSIALLGLGYAVLVAVFVSYRPRPRPVRPARTYSGGALLTVFAIGTAMNLAMAASGGFLKQYQNTGITTANIQTYRTFGFTALVALVICTAQHYRTGSFRNLMWMMLFVQIAFALAVSQKALAFEAVFAWLAARNYTTRRLPVRTVAIAAAIGLFVITPIIQASRTTAQYAVTGDQRSLSSAEATAGTVPRRVADYVSNFPGSALTGWDIINNRTDGSESLATAVAETPNQNPYRLGRYLPLILEAPIPHQLWPGKPSYDPSTYFSEKYAHETAAGGFGLTLGPTLPGDFYMNFGWLGVIVGMAVMGFVLRLVVWARAHFAGGAGVAIYVSVMLSVVLVELDMTAMGVTAFLQLIAAAVTYGLLRFSEVFAHRWTVTGQAARLK